MAETVNISVHNFQIISYKNETYVYLQYSNVGNVYYLKLVFIE